MVMPIRKRAEPSCGSKLNYACISHTTCTVRIMPVVEQMAVGEPAALGVGGDQITDFRAGLHYDGVFARDKVPAPPVSSPLHIPCKMEGWVIVIVVDQNDAPSLTKAELQGSAPIKLMPLMTTCGGACCREVQLYLSARLAFIPRGLQAFEVGITQHAPPQTSDGP